MTTTNSWPTRTSVAWTSARTHDLMDPNRDARLYSMYKYRQMLHVTDTAYTNGPQVSIMTYNILYTTNKTQAWCAEGLAPELLRERVVLAEIGRYNPDIVCLQEVDVGGNCAWWEKRLFDLGYESTFVYVGERTHGIGICFKHDLFSEVTHYYSNFDNYLVREDAHHPGSNRAMLFLCLGFKEKFLRSHSCPSRQGIIIGTTHLSPSSKYTGIQKTEQAGYFLRRADRFAQFVRRKTNADYRFYTVLTGDLNTREFNPFPCPDNYATLDRSSYKTTTTMNIDQVDHISRNQHYFQKLYKASYSRLVSLYTMAYGNLQHEPDIGQCWKFIDYILVVCERPNDENHNTGNHNPGNTAVQSLSELADFSDMKLMALLRIPTVSEVGASRKSQPAIGQCASDHVCLMAELELM